MNLLDTASLVVTPNGYKASKLYSIIPTDGSGDMTFARTGDTATRVNSSGLIETVLANKPRLDYLGSTCPKLLLEPQRTNLQTYSNQFDNGVYNKVRGTVTANSTISPDGTQNADTFASSSGESFPPALTLSPTFVGNTYYSFSLFAKVLGNTNILSIGYVDNVTGYTGGSALYNLATQTVTVTQSPNSSTTATIQNYGNGWYRCTLSFLTISTPTFNYIQFGQTTNDVSNTFAFYGAQLEAGTYATSYIPTTTASVTRNADSLNKTGISSLIGQTEGTFFVDFNVINTNGSIFYQLSNTIGANSYIDSIYMFQNGTSYFDIVSSLTAGIQASFRISSLTVGRHKVAIGYKANDFVAYVDGVLVGTDTSGTLGTYNVLDLYGTDIAAQLDYINASALWKTKLQNSELATLTTI